MRRGRLLIALVVALMALIGYWTSREYNPITGENQAIGLSAEQEVALGLQSAPEMVQQFGGADPDPVARAFVEEVGRRIVSATPAGDTPYRFSFTLLADPNTVNAFALPGGPIFITRGLLSKFETEAQLAGVLGHEVGHVLGRHAAERIAKQQLAQGLVGAVGVAGSEDGSGGQQTARLAAFVAQMAQLRYGREDEIQSDTLGVRFLVAAGYDPRGLLGVMRVLDEASAESRPPEFLSSHPDPGNREGIIQAAIERMFPDGVPPSLTEGQRLR
jgi:beta-barrel assembly-enhancing protease